MSASPDITIIFPAYNEAARIVDTIQQTVSYLRSRGLIYEIVVAADGDDGTRELVWELEKVDNAIHAIGSPKRSGKGKGIRDAIAISRGAIIGFVDADNKVPIDEFDKLHPKLLEGYPVVIGSRGFAESRIERRQPWYRQIGSKGFHLVVRTLVGLDGIRDTQCGFKFFTREAARDVFSRQKIDGYMFDVEILGLARHLGYEIAQVPIRWRDDGDSRLNLVMGNLQNARDILRISASRLFRRRPEEARIRLAARAAANLERSSSR